jgi:hypothetical protein
MRWVADHIRRHGMIHALWIILTLIFVIAAIVLGLASGDKINDYISFASSIASLLLAVVAIFYAMVSNQSFSETIGSLRQSATTVDDAAKSICKVTEELNDKSEDLLLQVSGLPPTLQKMSEKLDSITSPTAVPDESAAASRDDTHKSGMLFDSNKTAGVKMGLYILGVSAFTGNPFKVEDLFPEDMAWTSYILGFCGTVETFKPCGIQVTRAKDSEYRTESTGQVTTEQLLAQLALIEGDVVASHKARIDAYFKKGGHLEESAPGEPESQTDRID